jgi:predicted esterase
MHAQETDSSRNGESRHTPTTVPEHMEISTLGLSVEYRFVHVAPAYEDHFRDENVLDLVNAKLEEKKDLRKYLLRPFGSLIRKEGKKERKDGNSNAHDKVSEKGTTDKDKDKEKEKEKKGEKRKSYEQMEMERTFVVHLPPALAQVFHSRTLKASSNGASLVDSLELLDVDLPPVSEGNGTTKFFHHLREGVMNINWASVHNSNAISPPEGHTVTEELIKAQLLENSEKENDRNNKQDCDGSKNSNETVENKKKDEEKNVNEIKTETEGKSKTAKKRKNRRLGGSDQFYKEMGEGVRKMMQKEGQQIPLLLMLHGSDETAWNTQLRTQHDKKQSWLELAAQENFIIVFAQAQRWVYDWQPNLIHTGWKSGPVDRLYVQEVLDFVCKKYRCIDRRRVYAMGFSVGGLFLCDLLLRSENQMFAAVCNYMGGIDSPPTGFMLKEEEYKTFSIAWVPFAKTKTPMWIITGECEDNRWPCLRAKACLEENGWDITFEEMPRAGHEVLAAKTGPIWTYLSYHQMA